MFMHACSVRGPHYSMVREVILGRFFGRARFSHAETRGSRRRRVTTNQTNRTNESSATSSLVETNIVEGLLLRLLEDKTGAPGRCFWRMFGFIKQDLDRLYWCFANQPWMGAPRDFDQNDFEPFEEKCSSSIQLWRPGSLAKYADRFAEEYIEL